MTKTSKVLSIIAYYLSEYDRLFANTVWRKDIYKQPRFHDIKAQVCNNRN